MRPTIRFSLYPPDNPIAPDAGSESDPNSGHPVVFDHRIRGDRDLIARPHDQIDRPGRGVLTDLEAPEDDARREQNLVETFVEPVRPIRVVDFDLGPEILGEMVLKGGIPQDRIAEPRHVLLSREVCRLQPVYGNLHADGRLNIEVAPPFTEGD